MKTTFDYCLEELSKLAEEAPKKNPHVEAAKVVGSGILGLGSGYLAGAGLGKGLEYLTGRKGGNVGDLARKIGPIAGAAGGILYPIWQGHQRRMAEDAVKSAYDHPTDGVPRK